MTFDEISKYPEGTIFIGSHYEELPIYHEIVFDVVKGKTYRYIYTHIPSDDNPEDESVKVRSFDNFKAVVGDYSEYKLYDDNQPSK